LKRLHIVVLQKEVEVEIGVLDGKLRHVEEEEDAVVVVIVILEKR
jgi:hypothetical protein